MQHIAWRWNDIWGMGKHTNKWQIDIWHIGKQAKTNMKPKWMYIWNMSNWQMDIQHAIRQVDIWHVLNKQTTLHVNKQCVWDKCAKCKKQVIGIENNKDFCLGFFEKETIMHRTNKSEIPSYDQRIYTKGNYMWSDNNIKCTQIGRDPL